MYCSNCGTRLDDGAVTCSHCGMAQEPSENVPAPVNTDVLKILQSLTGADLSHDRVSAIVRQVIGLIALMIAVFAIARKPEPGIFILYAVPAILGGVIIVLERRASVGKAIFILAMLVPYVSLYLVGVPPIFVSGSQNLDKVAEGLGSFFGAVGAANAFLVIGFLFLIFSSIANLIFSKHSLISGGAALAVSVVFALIFMAMLGSPAASVKQSLTIEEQLDSGVKIHTTALAPTEDGALTEATAFKSNELIYPYVEGMTSGAHFGFRLLDASGKVVIPFDRGVAVRAKGTGLDKSPALNTLDARLAAGSYQLELMLTQGWKTMLIARQAVTISADVNPNYGSQTGEDYAWLAKADKKNVTAFGKNDPMHLILDGGRLQGSVNILIKDNADKVKLDKDFSATPMGLSDVTLADKASALGAGEFVAVITSEGKQALTIYFTVK